MEGVLRTCAKVVGTMPQSIDWDGEGGFSSGKPKGAGQRASLASVVSFVGWRFPICWALLSWTERQGQSKNKGPEGMGHGSLTASLPLRTGEGRGSGGLKCQYTAEEGTGIAENKSAESHHDNQ
jgi:hypothetical protein